MNEFLTKFRLWEFDADKLADDNVPPWVSDLVRSGRLYNVDGRWRVVNQTAFIVLVPGNWIERWTDGFISVYGAKEAKHIYGDMLPDCDEDYMGGFEVIA